MIFKNIKKFKIFLASVFCLASLLFCPVVFSSNSDSISASLTIIPPPDYIDTVPRSSTPIYIITNEYDVRKSLEEEAGEEATKEDEEIVEEFLIITDFSINGIEVVRSSKVLIDAKIIITDTTPTFVGVVNRPFAFIFLKVMSDPVSGVVQADANGDWKWTVPTELEYGDHLLFLAASLKNSEPEAGAYYVLNFKIVPEEKLVEEETIVEEKEEKSLIRPVVPAEEEMIKETQEIKAEFGLLGLSDKREYDIFDDIGFDLSVGSEVEKKRVESVVITIRDNRQNIIFQKIYPASAFDGLSLSDKLLSARGFRLGGYTIESIIQTEGQKIVAVEDFSVVVKQKIPLFGILTINTEIEKLFFTLFNLSLLGFLLILLAEVLFFARLAKFGEVEDNDLRKLLA